MSECTVPAITCDSEYGCDDWAIDYFSQTAAYVGRVKITSRVPSPDWVRDDNWHDFCAKHADEAVIGGGRS